MYTFRQMEKGETEAVKALFTAVFTAEPWMDDWSDEAQLNLYLQDLMGQGNSLTYGLFEGEELVALSMGRIKHWYTGTEYCIDEFCVRADKQRQGVGSRFLREIEADIRAKGMTHLFLLTETDVPAYQFYQKNGFYGLETNVAFAKRV